VTVIPHGVDHDRFRPGPAGDPADLGALAAVGVRPPYVAFVGTPQPRKGIDVLVRAFDRVAGSHPALGLVLAGGRGWGSGAIDAALGAMAHRDRVVRTGYLPDEALPALLRQATAVAFPALAEGFGIPALEALACGAPLVTTSGTAMEEVAGEAALMVPPGDAAALADALDALVRGGPDVAERRHAGLSVAAAYTWDASAAGHVAAYLRASGRPE
jgi:glycosyltransferase involved in cell wall biosynthesis